MTVALNLAAHAAPPAPANAPRDLPGKPPKAPAFASMVDALSRNAAHVSDSNDAGAIGGGARSSAGKNEGEAKSATPIPADPTRIDSAAVLPLTFALALPAAPLDNRQIIAPRGSEAAPAKTTALSPRLSQATENALSLAPANFAPHESRAAAIAIAPVDQSASPAAPPIAPTPVNTSVSSIPAQAPQAAQMVSPPGPDLGARSVRSRTFLALDRARIGGGAGSPTQPPTLPAPGAEETKSLPNDAPLKSVADDHKKAPPERPATAPVPSLAGASSASAPVSVPSFAGPLKAEQLPQFLAAHANELAPASAETAAAAPAALARHVIKELDVELAPAGLGSVSVKMRLSNGKLSVVMEVSSAGALKAIENEQGAIAVSLGSNTQPLESLVIKQSEPSQNRGDPSDASNSQHAAREDGQTGSDSAAQQGQSSNRRDPNASRASPPAAPAPVAPRGRADSLLV